MSMNFQYKGKAASTVEGLSKVNIYPLRQAWTKHRVPQHADKQRGRIIADAIRQA